MNLIFDLDGTLLNTLEDLQTAVNFALGKFDYPKRSIEEIRAAVGDGLRMLMLRSLPKGSAEDTADHALRVMKEYYTRHCMDQTRPYEGVIELLGQLKSDGHRLCIVSNKAHELVQVLKDKFFSDLIDLALGESAENEKKPSLDMIKACMQCFGQNAVYIGDSEVDILTAKNAGIPCISVGWGYRESEYLIKNGAQKIALSPLELRKLI